MCEDCWGKCREEEGDGEGERLEHGDLDWGEEEATMGICSLCGQMLEEGACEGCSRRLGEARRREPGRERLSVIITRIQLITGREGVGGRTEVVHKYMELGRDEEATVTALGFLPQREGVRRAGRRTEDR